MRKLLKKLRLIFISSTIGEDSWNARNPIERFFYIIEVPVFLLIAGILPFIIPSLKSVQYNQILFLVLSVWLLGRIISYGSTYTKISKEKAWILVISNIFFDLLFIVVLFDILLNTGLFDYLRRHILSRIQDKSLDYLHILIFLVVIVFYLTLFFVLTKLRHALPKLFPIMKGIWKTNNLGRVLVDFILLSLYVILFFAFIYYIIFVASGFNGFSYDKISFLEFIFYSFNVLYSSPVSSIEPINTITKSITAIESLFSYLILVVFISLILNNHTKKTL